MQTFIAIELSTKMLVKLTSISGIDSSKYLVSQSCADDTRGPC